MYIVVHASGTHCGRGVAHVDTHVCTHVDTHVCTRVDTHVYTHVCTHSYMQWFTPATDGASDAADKKARGKDKASPRDSSAPIVHMLFVLGEVANRPMPIQMPSFHKSTCMSIHMSVHMSIHTSVQVPKPPVDPKAPPVETGPPRPPAVGRIEMLHAEVLFKKNSHLSHSNVHATCPCTAKRFSD